MKIPCNVHCVLLQYLGDLGCEPVVFKNDEKTVSELRDLDPAGIVISPGPGLLAYVLLFKLETESISSTIAVRPRT